MLVGFQEPVLRARELGSEDKETSCLLLQNSFANQTERH